MGACRREIRWKRSSRIIPKSRGKLSKRRSSTARRILGSGGRPCAARQGRREISTACTLGKGSPSPLEGGGRAKRGRMRGDRAERDGSERSTRQPGLAGAARKFAELPAHGAISLLSITPICRLRRHLLPQGEKRGLSDAARFPVAVSTSWSDPRCLRTSRARRAPSWRNRRPCCRASSV
jgi:hypothetical protein